MPDNTELESSGKLEIQRAEPMPVAHAQPSAADILQAVVDKGITPDNVNALKDIVALVREERAFQAEREFATAFNALQSEMPRIVAKTAVPNNDGTVRYKFAAYEDIMEQVRP